MIRSPAFGLGIEPTNDLKTLELQDRQQPSRKYSFDSGQVEIAADLVHEMDADAKQPRVAKLTDLRGP